MQLKRRHNHNCTETPNHLSQLERIPESSTITLQEHYIITKKDPLETNRGSPPTKTGNDSPAKIREEPFGTLHLERCPSATHRDVDPDIT